MPSLYQIEENGRIKEAILDVVLSFPGETGLVPLYVTIRCPHGEDEREAAINPGHAARSGCVDKDERYGMNRVVPVALETYGRMDSRSCAELRAVCAAAARCNSLSTASGCPRVTGAEAYNQVRKAIERTLLWEQADTMICSIGQTTAGAAYTRHRTCRSSATSRRCLFPPSTAPNPVSLYLQQTGSAHAPTDADAIANATAAAGEVTERVSAAPEHPGVAQHVGAVEAAPPESSDNVSSNASRDPGGVPEHNHQYSLASYNNSQRREAPAHQVNNDYINTGIHNNDQRRDLHGGQPNNSEVNDRAERLVCAPERTNAVAGTADAPSYAPDQVNREKHSNNENDCVRAFNHQYDPPYPACHPGPGPSPSRAPQVFLPPRPAPHPSSGPSPIQSALDPTEQ